MPVPYWSLLKYINDNDDVNDSIKSILYCDEKRSTFKAIGFELKFISASTHKTIHTKTRYRYYYY